VEEINPEKVILKPKNPRNFWL